MTKREPVVWWYNCAPPGPPDLDARQTTLLCKRNPGVRSKEVKTGCNLAEIFYGSLGLKTDFCQ
jgi:hypothetical protein